MDNYVPRLKKVYKDEIAPALVKEFNYTTPMQIPAITVTVTLTSGSFVQWFPRVWKRSPA